MSGERRLSRRAFIVLGAASIPVAAGAAKLLYDQLAENGFNPRLQITRRAASIFERLGPAQRLGRAYLSAHPAEGTERQLAGLLERSNPRWRHGDPRTVARDAVREDYLKGRLVSVGGWLLSQTEARLAALTTFG